mmetsp:Transcript_1443/g.3893  ORF Transcript_1443/g.3893 Transcript_1443/m.3893 type:complete len:135 (-) Transcript_1443:24-428(-)
MRASRRRHVHGGEAMLSPGAREGWTRRARVGGPLHFSDTHAEGGSNHFTDTRAWWDALWRRGGGGRDTCAAPTESCCTLTMDPGDTGVPPARLQLPSPPPARVLYAGCRLCTRHSGGTRQPRSVQRDMIASLGT